MRLALNTNRYTDLCRGDAFVVETVESLVLLARDTHFDVLPQLTRVQRQFATGFPIVKADANR
jgi:hypothetical protein